ncbi:MAG: glycine cleavage T C-terminal barrel domain-containing protein, partial [Pseudomonadota bacterium]
RALLDAGQDQMIREIGFNALLSLRIEKSFGIWSCEFTQRYTASQTGMDRWIDWQKPDFIGRQAAEKIRDEQSDQQVLVTLRIDSKDADATGYEPIWHNDRRVGYITSGAYGHTLGQSLAMGFVNRELADVGMRLITHIVGVACTAEIITPSPYDPEGKSMRTNHKG